MIPKNDPVPIDLEVTGTVKVYDEKGKEIMAARFDAIEKKPKVLFASLDRLEMA